MIENVPIQDTTCSRLGRVERLEGNLVRFWFYIDQRSLHDGAVEHVVNLKLIMPACNIPDGIFQTLTALKAQIEDTPLMVAEMAH